MYIQEWYFLVQYWSDCQCRNFMLGYTIVSSLSWGIHVWVMNSLRELTLYEYPICCVSFVKRQLSLQRVVLLSIPSKSSFCVKEEDGGVSITSASLQRKFRLPAKSVQLDRNCPTGPGCWSQDRRGCQGSGRQELCTRTAGCEQGLFQSGQMREIYWRSVTRQGERQGEGN